MIGIPPVLLNDILVGLALLLAAAAALLPRGAPLGLPWTWTAAALAASAPAAAVWDDSNTASGYAPWFVRVATIVIAVLLLRGRPVVGWAAAAAGYGILIGWGVTAGAPLADWGGVVMRQAATLLAIEVFAILLARTQRSIAAFRSEERMRVATTERRAQTVKRRELESARIRDLVTPVLRRIASGEDGESLRRESELLGAELRDLLRGARLAGEPVTAAARSARMRGVDVVLLDDLGPTDLDTQQRAAALTWVAERLARTNGHRATARLSADGARAAVSFYAEGSSARPEVLVLRADTTSVAANNVGVAPMTGS